MIYSKNLVPKTYTRSRNYQQALKFLDLVANAFKLDCDNFTSIIDPLKCKEEYLPLLASYSGYRYDYNLSVSMNRNIIRYYKLLMKNRGSINGIRLAVALSLENIDFSQISSLTDLSNVVRETEVVDPTINGNYLKPVYSIYLYYPDYNRKLFELLELIRPIGAIFQLYEAGRAKQPTQYQVGFNDYKLYDYIRVSTTNNTFKYLTIPDIPTPEAGIYSYSFTLDNNTTIITISSMGTIGTYKDGDWVNGVPHFITSFTLNGTSLTFTTYRPLYKKSGNSLVGYENKIRSRLGLADSGHSEVELISPNNSQSNEEE